MKVHCYACETGPVLTSRRPRSGAPKPNTQFLRHIIRQTDSHNSALLAKEAEESRARLRQLSREKETGPRGAGRLTPPGVTDDEREYKKRKRSHRDDDDGRRRTRSPERTRRNTERDMSRKDRHSVKDRRRDKDRYEDSSDEDGRSRHKHSRGSRDKSHRQRHPDSDRRKSRRDDEDTRHKHKSRRSYSSSSDRSRSPASRRHHRSSRHRDRSRSRHRHTSTSRHRSREHEERRTSPKLTQKHRDLDWDSDPLEAIVGPLPPPPAPAVRARGRGAHKANSMAMDERFSSTYNPSTDVHLNSDVEDDWGDALEALKDRERWKQQGAERLKAAGFSDEQVKRWEKGDEKTEEDVRWALKGEGREWDRGKVVDDEGHVNLKAEWGRLT